MSLLCNRTSCYIPKFEYICHSTEPSRTEIRKTSWIRKIPKTTKTRLPPAPSPRGWTAPASRTQYYQWKIAQTGADPVANSPDRLTKIGKSHSSVMCNKKGARGKPAPGQTSPAGCSITSCCSHSPGEGRWPEPSTKIRVKLQGIRQGMYISIKIIKRQVCHAGKSDSDTQRWKMSINNIYIF